MAKKEDGFEYLNEREWNESQRPLRPLKEDFTDLFAYGKAYNEYLRDLHKWKNDCRKNDIEGRAVIKLLQAKKKQRKMSNDDYKKRQKEKIKNKKINEWM